MGMPKAVSFSKLQEGKRDRGAPGKRYKDRLKRQLAQAGINHQSWQQEASDRDSWRSSVTKASQRQRGMKPLRKDSGGRKSEQHFNHALPKPSSVQSAVGGSHQESESTITDEHAGTDHNLPKVLVCEESAITITNRVRTRQWRLY